MKIRTDFVTNSSASSYVIQKRLVIEGNRVPINVSHEVTGEYDRVFYWVNGSYRINWEILDAAIVPDNYGDLKADNAQLSKFVADFWANEAEIISRFYKESAWQIEERDFREALNHMEKYSVYGNRTSDGREETSDYDFHENRERMYHMFIDAELKASSEDEPDVTFRAYSVRSKKRFSYFNKYVRCVNVYLYNTVYNKTIKAETDSIYQSAAVMLAQFFEEAETLIEKLRGKNLLPIFVGELPVPDEFPTVPTDIWLLTYSTNFEAAEDIISVELTYLKTWLEAYAAPSSSDSLWEDIKKFIEKHANGEEFYPISDRRSNGTLYRQYWDGLRPVVSENQNEPESVCSGIFREDLFNLNPDTDFDNIDTLPRSNEDYDAKDIEFIDKWELLSIGIEDLDLSVRSHACLKRAGIDTVGGIVAKTEEELKKVRNLGRKSLEEVVHKVESIGLKLAPSLETKEEESP